MIPTELGGSGAAHSDICAALRVLAGYCSSTALAASMHQHLVAAGRVGVRVETPLLAALVRKNTHLCA